MDEGAFKQLHADTVQGLRRYAVRTLGSVTEGDDVVQETYLRALSTSSFPVEPLQARAYLFRVASNLIVDVWRRGLRTQGYEETEGLALEDVELRLDLAHLFQTLKLQERQLIWLAYVEGYDHAAIAAALGLRKASVRVLLHRARKRFEIALRGGGYD